MVVLRIFLGLVLGGGLAAGSHYALMQLLGFESAAIPAAVVSGVIGVVYGAIALGLRIYGIGFFSFFGFFLDMTWSMLNTAAALLVWLPACSIWGSGFVPPNSQSQRSGAFVYRNNPRGGGYAATTIGTVIGGGWNSHEEIHIWQGRIFGPAYMIVYILALLINMLFRPITGKIKSLTLEAYHRICFEDWAYWGGEESSGGATIRWGGWIGGFFLSTLYVSLFLLIVIGIAANLLYIWIPALVGLVVYSLIRTLTPHSH